MNQIKRNNRSKKVRINAERHGNASIRLKPDTTLDGRNYLTIEKQAANKTPKVQRIGNYYAQVKSSKGTKLIPAHKLTKTPAKPGLFNPMTVLGKLFNKTA